MTWIVAAVFDLRDCVLVFWFNISWIVALVNTGNIYLVWRRTTWIVAVSDKSRNIS